MTLDNLGTISGIWQHWICFSKESKHIFIGADQGGRSGFWGLFFCGPQNPKNIKKRTCVCIFCYSHNSGTRHENINLFSNYCDNFLVEDFDLQCNICNSNNYNVSGKF